MARQIIYEGILDNIEASDAHSASSVASDTISSSDFNHTIDVCISGLYNDKMDKMGMTIDQLRKLDDIITSYVGTLALFDSFAITYSLSEYRNEKYPEESLPIDDFVSKLKNDNPHLTSYSAITVMGGIRIRISYIIVPNNTFRMFSDAVFGIYRVAYQIIAEKFKFRISSAGSIVMRFEVQFDYTENDYSIKNLDYNELKKIYCNMQDTDQSNEWKTPVNLITYHTNTEGVHLAPDVHINEVVGLHPGDFIYFRKNHGLVLRAESENDIPIAQFVYRNENDNSLRCVSLRFMSQVNPKNGCVRPCDRISFGNFENTIFTDDIISTSDGLEITDATVRFINSLKRTMMEKRPKFYQFDLCGWGNMPLFEIVMQYRTPGTKPGDWYVPAADELKKIKRVIEKFDDIRKENNIEEFPEFECATAQEIDDNTRVTFDFDTGQVIDDCKKKGHSDEFAIAFLKISLK